MRSARRPWRPGLPPGDLLIDAPPTGPYVKGDVITFGVQAAPGIDPVVTHRVHARAGRQDQHKGRRQPARRTRAPRPRPTWWARSSRRSRTRATHSCSSNNPPDCWAAHRTDRADALVVPVLRHVGAPRRHGKSFSLTHDPGPTPTRIGGPDAFTPMLIRPPGQEANKP